MDKNKLFWWYTGKPTTLDEVLSNVGRGWHTLVSNLIDDLFQLDWDGQIADIKEKFGTLRFYIGPETTKQSECIANAEKKSGTICEVCGKPGVLREGGWLKTLCDEHANGRKPVHA